MTASRPLSNFTLIQIRGIAAKCWMESEGDPEIAEALFAGRYPGVDQRTAALDLFQHWIDHGGPQVVMTQEEANLLGLESD